MYQADGYAVKELIKVTSVLYNAMKTNVDDLAESADDASSINFDISARVSLLKNFPCVSKLVQYTKWCASYSLET